MKIQLIQIGNSKGVRLPAGVIKACGFDDELEMRVEGGVVTLAPLHNVREGWGEAFEKMAACGDDEQLIPDGLANQFDDDEWSW